MLYDQSQLARVYLHAYKVTGNGFYKRITTEILDYFIREMTSPEGEFYSSQDADSKGHEGKFFVWTPEEIPSALGGSTSGLLIVSKSKPRETNDAALFMDAHRVTPNGNFEGKNIQARNARHAGQNRIHFLFGQNCGQMFRFFRAHGLNLRVKWNLQDLTIQEQDRAERLGLCRGSNVSSTARCDKNT